MLPISGSPGIVHHRGTETRRKTLKKDGIEGTEETEDTEKATRERPLCLPIGQAGKRIASLVERAHTGAGRRSAGSEPLPGK
jgi:hypothetical protein